MKLIFFAAYDVFLRRLFAISVVLLFFFMLRATVFAI